MGGKSVGLLIPEDCRHIFVFDNKEDFTAQIQSGKMKPLYGEKEFQNEYMKLHVAYIPTSATG